MSIQKEDVYETEDFPEDDENLRKDELQESKDVERIHLDVDSALKRFKGRILSADKVDFSDSIKRKRYPGYGCGAYVFEVLGSESEEVETNEQKFERIRCELSELYDSLQNQENEDEKVVSSVNSEEVMAMLETLKAIQIKKPITDKSIEETKTSLANIIHGSNLDAEYAFMDARLKRIEDFIGASGVTDEMSKNINRMPIYEIVDDLHMRIQLLNPTHVDALYSRINQVLIKLQKVEEKKQERGDTEFEEKVDKLYEMMMKWDTVCVTLPSAVRRMNNLQKLHEQAQQFNAKLSQLVGTRVHLAKIIEGEQMAMFDFRHQTYDALKKLDIFYKLSKKVNSKRKVAR